MPPSMILCSSALRRLARLAAVSVLVSVVSVSVAAESRPGTLTISTEATAEALRRPVEGFTLGSLETSSDSPSATTTTTTSIASAGRSCGAEMAIETRAERIRFERSLLLRHVGPRLARGDYVGTWLARPNNLAARVALRVQQQEHGFEAGLDEVTQQLDDVERKFNEMTKDMMYILKFVGMRLRYLFWGILVFALLEMASRR